MRSFFVTFLSLILVSASAQQLLTLPENDPNALHWNPTFMQRNGIASIVGTIQVKREGQRVIDKAESYLYRFDEQGNTIYRNTSYGSPGSGQDTACVQFKYDKEGRLLRELSIDLGGHFELANTYDSTGNLVTQTYCKIKNLNTDRYDLEPGERTEISDERYKYESSEKVTKKIYYNDRELPFREKHLHYNEKGYLIQIEDIYLMTRKRKIEQFTYDDKGRLAQRLKHDASGQVTTRILYFYDSVNNLTKKEVYQGQAMKTHEEYLYDLNTGLISARLSKDQESGIIQIVKYKHNYR